MNSFFVLLYLLKIYLLHIYLTSKDHFIKNYYGNSEIHMSTNPTDAVPAEVRKLLVWYMKENPKRLKTEATAVCISKAKANITKTSTVCELDVDSDADTQVLGCSDCEDEEYTISSIDGPYINGAGHLFAESISWNQTLEDCNGNCKNKKRIKVQWPDEKNASICDILYKFPSALVTKQLDDAWQQAVSLKFKNVKYSPLDKTGSEKARSNQNFADAIKSLTHKSGNVVYLEESTANTTRCLRPVTKLQLVAVNYDPVVLSDAIVRAHSTGLMTFSGSLDSYLVSCHPHSIAGIFADYCSTFAGNATGISPAYVDLPILFGQKLLKDGAVFAMVVCTRLRIKTIAKDDIVPYICNLASNYGYSLILTHSFSYGSMMSVQFAVRI